jgi:outer membrane murein-binding lipoprotein Lpp
MMPAPPRSRFALAAVAGALILAGCSQGGAPAPEAAQQKAQVQATEAARDLNTYRQLLRIHNDQMAASMGEDIVQRYPASAAAKEVQQTLPAVEKRWKEKSEKARLAALWQYQVAPMAGGTQSTAAIYDSQPADVRVQLVLRRHSSWGQSAFLYSDAHGFVCRGDCTIEAKFDDKLHPIKAYAPPTGEPALMIRDDKGFIALLEKAKKISLPVTMQDGEKKVDLVYEVGGFVPDHWQPLPKQGGKK